VSKKTVKTTTSPIVLASSSVYRRELLQRLGLPFAVATPAVDERPRPGETAANLTVRLAEAKARAVAPLHPASLIIGSDQVAEAGGLAVGKPHDRADAVRMLRSMRGQTIVFHTGLALLNSGSGRLQVALVDVACTFRSLDDPALEAYVDRDQPFDCAGAIRVETLGIALFTRVASDDPTALIGLPLIRLIDMLAVEGVPAL
jgi:septum formation protein